MPKILYTDSKQSSAQEIPFEKGETILSALLRAGKEVTYGCRAGACQSCLMQSSSDIPSTAQTGLNSAQKELGFFMTCRCSPNNDFKVFPAEKALTKVKARIIDKTMLSRDVIRIRIEKLFDYHAGQYATLWKDAVTARSYSIASHPTTDPYIEFHIRYYVDGKFSAWAYKDLHIGDSIYLTGPMGQCFYTQADANHHLFLCGTGTGAAPLYGILKDALNRDHKQKIHFMLGGSCVESFYLANKLNVLCEKYDRLSVYYVSQKEENINRLPYSRFSKIFIGDVYTAALKCIPDFKDYRVFLCGGSTFVTKMKKICFLAGASMHNIASDPFISFEPVPTKQ